CAAPMWTLPLLCTNPLPGKPNIFALPIALISLNRSAMVKETLNLFEIAKTRFETAADVIRLPRDVREVMIQPKRQLIVSIPVRMDNAGIGVFRVNRFRTTIAQGQAKGEIGIHQKVPWNKIKAL